MATDPSSVALIVALLGAGGLSGVVVEIIKNVKLHRQGVPGKEEDRREDIIRQRDEALAHTRLAEAAERAEEARADEERTQRIRWQEETARLRLKLINAGHDPDNPEDAPRPKE